ncbi:MAG: general secretion pathway protein GspK [Planctomycetes bacterium]|nr:general secretion pathway protein GspK [Planctomycetota bacterium]
MNRCRPRRRRGVLLIVVLVLVLLMSAAAYGFLIAMRTEDMAARTSGDRLIGEHAAFSGIDFVSAMLERPRGLRDNAGQTAIAPNPLEGVWIDDPLESLGDDGPQFAVAPPPDALPDAIDASTGLVDESTKLHLGRLVDWERFRPDSGKQALMRLPGMTDDVADSILDWIDADARPRFAGAEADAYAAVRGSVLPRNGWPLDLEELLLVRGVDPVRLLGEAFDRPSQTGRERLGETARAAMFAEEPDVPWSQYLTMVSGERNESRDGAARVFLNDQRLDVLHGKLSGQFPVAVANFVVLYRQYGPGSGSGDAMAAEQITVDFSRPASRWIRSPLDLLDTSVSLTYHGKLVRAASPFTSEPMAMRTQLPDWLDRTTVSSAPVLTGRVNINRAPREVLLALPGMDEGIVERLMAARSMSGSGNAEHDHVAWPLTEGVVDLPTMRRLFSFINVGGDVFRGTFWGRAARGALPYRAEVVLDATDRVARLAYFRESTEPGRWPPGESDEGGFERDDDGSPRGAAGAPRQVAARQSHSRQTE